MGSDADYVSVIFAKESTFATPPAGPSVYTRVRLLSESFAQETDTNQSNELDPSRNIPGVYRTNIRATGSIEFEFSYGTFDELMRAVLFSSDWTTASDAANGASDVAATNATNTLTRTAAWDNTPAVGDWVEISGFAESSNNGIAKVVSADANNIQLEGVTITDESAGATVTIKIGSKIVNGVTKDSFTFQRDYTDLTDVYAQYVGMTPDSMSLSITATDAITGSFGYQGKREIPSATNLDATPISAPTNLLMSGIDGVEKFLEAGEEVRLVEFSMEVSNGLRNRPLIGELGPDSIGSSRCQVTGSAQFYFSDPAIAEKYINFTTSSFAFVTVDENGNRYAFDIPEIKYASSTRAAGGTGTDVILTLDFQAYKDAVEGMTIRVVRFPAA